jgi:hypothetical protein
MNAAQLRKSIEICADYAGREEPTNVDARARIFVASLSGRIEQEEPELSAVIWCVLDRAAAAPTEPALKASD